VNDSRWDELLEWIRVTRDSFEIESNRDVLGLVLEKMSDMEAIQRKQTAADLYDSFDGEY